MKNKTVMAAIGSVIIFACIFMIVSTLYKEVVTKEKVYYVTDSILGSLDPNQIMGDDNPAFTVIDKDPGRFTVDWKQYEINMAGTQRIDTVGDGILRVMGSCWNGKGEWSPEYPVTVDTGFAGSVKVSDSIVQDAGLGFYTNNMDDDVVLLCHLRQLKIGGITFVNPICTVRPGHYKVKSFRESAVVQHQILLGLRMLKNFKYVLWDRRAGQIEFSGRDSFNPDEPDLWQSFPMVVETPNHDTDILFITISIAGKERKVQLDTGADSWVHLRASDWEDFSRGMDCEKSESVRFKMVEGFRESDSYVVRDMEFCGDVTGSVSIFVEPDEGVEFSHSEMLVGMRFFKGCILVLDFENELLWVKKLFAE